MGQSPCSCDLQQFYIDQGTYKWCAGVANFDNPCLPVCEQDFTKIETPRYEDPRPVFNSLAYNQLTHEEFRNGYYMEILDGR